MTLRNGNTRNTGLLSFVLLLAGLGIFSSLAVAQAPATTAPPVIVSALANLAKKQLTIVGTNLGVAAPMILVDGQTPAVLSNSVTNVTAALPSTIVAGDYLLTLTNETTGLKTSFDLTVGAIGPKGATGAQGVQGPQGTQGPQGLQGPAGAGVPTLAGVVNADGSTSVGRGFVSVHVSPGSYSILIFPGIMNDLCIPIFQPYSGVYLTGSGETPNANGTYSLNVTFSGDTIFYFICAQQIPAAAANSALRSKNRNYMPLQRFSTQRAE
jgi:hypothetical protein